ATPLIAGEYEEHGQIPHASAHEGGDHATDPSFLDGAEVAVRVAGQRDARITRHRLVGRARRSTAAPRALAARPGVHAPDFVDRGSAVLADVRRAAAR